MLTTPLRLLLICWALLLAFPGGAWAAPPAADPPDAERGAKPPDDTVKDEAPSKPNAEPSADPAASKADETARARATSIQALIAGTLEPAVDARQLFVVDLNDAALGDRGERLIALLQRIADPAAPPTEAPTDDGSGWAAYERALVEYLRLDPERRKTLATEHRERHEAWLDEHGGARSPADLLARTERRAADLEAFLAGDLSPEVDPNDLLELDLGATSEVALSESRRQGWIAPSESDGTGSDALRTARDRLDVARRRYLSLSPQARKLLADKHRARGEAPPPSTPTADGSSGTDDATAKDVHPAASAAEVTEAEPEEEPEEVRTARDITAAEAEAVEAAAEQELALERARLADTKAKAAFEEENARLLGIKSEQALYDAEANRRRAEGSDFRTTVADWEARISELRDSTQYAAEKAAEADPMYEELRGDLGSLRTRLKAELERIPTAGSDAPRVGPALDAGTVGEEDHATLVALRRELVQHTTELELLDQTVTWALAEGLREDIVRLNRARIELLELASPELRSSMTGFGSAGVGQAKREFEQIKLELGFHALRIPRYPSHLRAKLQDSAIPVLIGFAQFGLVIGGFLWWRRRGSGMLERVDRSLRERNPRTGMHAAGITAVWYLRRVRRPLEVLLVLWLSVDLIGRLDDLPEVNLLWIIALWVLAGLAAILFVDAVAARETKRFARQDNAKLRIHSLRVVGINVIAVGLILSLTRALVGRGAIYSWVFSTCWVLSFPVAVYLVHRWRPIIFDRVEAQPEQTPFTGWVLAQKSGPMSYLAATGGALYLLGRGVAGWVMRQLAEFEATRRLLAYLFRREVAKQAAAAQADARFRPIEGEAYDAFDPEHLAAGLLDNAAASELERVIAIANVPRATLSAVVGERGAGKSVLVKRMCEALGEEKVRVLQCPEEGYEALEAQIAALTPSPELRGDALCAAVRDLGAVVIAIDDLQRLVVPAVNGLGGLDRFTTFARAVGGNVSWVVTIGSASWHYIKRARGERVFFEQVVSLPRWSEEQLGELLQAHCAIAKLEPSFEGLVVPRPANAPIEEDDNKTQTGYYRLLWDFSRGNPAVALHAFRESLFVGPNDEIVVRLFKEPSPEEIEDLPPSILFVLRSVVQLELAMADEVIAATQFPRDDVNDALRFCAARGYIEPLQGGVRLTWPWYRTITTVLQRQHLLSTL